MFSAQFIPKSEAAELIGAAAGDLLDLDAVYRGLFVWPGYICVSETALDEGLKRYGPIEVLNGLID